MIDLLGDIIATPERTNDRPEAAALYEVLKALRASPMVAWCERQNTGATRMVELHTLSDAATANYQRTVFDLKRQTVLTAASLDRDSTLEKQP